MSKHDAFKALLEHLAEGPTIDHLETMFDVVKAMGHTEEDRFFWDKLIMDLIIAHPSY